ncbi:MAG TPA: C1 family peptidase [Ignavibacteriaceae bacterium]|nr:C1 family peptidase [Ignavibacteriaceae bacterium]
MKSKLYFYGLLIFSILTVTISAQDKKEEKKERHTFKMITDVATTSVKNQAQTGTCWDFATQSFLESELLRMGKGQYNLSEMFNVRYTYPLKAEKYIRYHGKWQFGPGGQAHDVIKIFDTFGAVPANVYPGLEPGDSLHNNFEMDAVLGSVLNTIIKRNKISDHYKDIISSICDIYLGKVPSEFEYEGKKYTPKSFAKSLGINTDDYVEITSYTHHPFYSKFILEVPDNWTEGEYYNVPLDDLIKIMDNALQNGYSIDWDGDVGRDNFYRKEEYAVVPFENDTSKTGPEKEQTITQELRQKSFDDYTTTDDHLMHITGLAKDQAGTKFYYTKNSWGTKDKKYAGFWYMSEPFVRLRTVAIMVHKDAIPKEIREKLGL